MMMMILKVFYITLYYHYYNRQKESEEKKENSKKKKGRKRRGYIALFRNGSTNKMQVISLKIKHHPSLSLLIKRKLAKRTNVLNCLTYSKFLERVFGVTNRQKWKTILCSGWPFPSF